jgi:hypothetical protein
MAADDKLVFAVLHLGKNGMEVVAQAQGERHLAPQGGVRSAAR